MKALIAEDDQIARKVLHSLLKDIFECEMAIDGFQALEMFKKNYEDNNKYDIIFIDIMMPKKDGQALLKEIREFENAKKLEKSNRIKAIMTTALGNFENINEAFKSKCDGYLVKPISSEKLFYTLNKLGLSN